MWSACFLMPMATRTPTSSLVPAGITGCPIQENSAINFTGMTVAEILLADTTAFPSNSVNVGTVAAYDFDNDGDTDLFVGGRSVSYLYGFIPKSYIYVNDGKGHFQELASEKIGELAHIGMVTGASWSDVSGDQQKELIITGEWMSPRIFNYAGGRFQEVKDKPG